MVKQKQKKTLFIRGTTDNLFINDTPSDYCTNTYTARRINRVR